MSLNSFYEKLGRSLFTRIRIPFFLLLLFFPLFLATLLLVNARTSLQETQARFSLSMKKGKTALEKKIRKEQFLERHTKPDPYFLNREIESLSFLNSEKNKLGNWLAHPAIANKKWIKERLEFLNGTGNRLSFIEENLQISDSCKETQERQRHPIQVDNENLKTLLALIEDLPTSDIKLKSKRPQLLITNFSLHKITTPLKHEVFEIDIDLLRREFL